MAPPMRKRSTQIVSTKTHRKKVTLWMNAEVNACGTAKRIAKKAVDHFPAIFSQNKRKNALEKARQWYESADYFLNQLQTAENRRMTIISSKQVGRSVRRIGVKSLGGRGRKRPFWKETLHHDLLDEFKRMRAAGIKADAEQLRIWALGLLDDDEFPISKNDVLNATGKPADQVISRSWIQDFQQRFNIVARIRTGNKTLSQEQIAQSNKEMAYFLGNLKRRYDGGLDPANVENYDETHFVFDMDDGRCLDFQGSKRVTYAELSSGGEK